MNSSVLTIARWPILRIGAPNESPASSRSSRNAVTAAVARPGRDGREHDVELGNAAVGDPGLLAVEHVAAVRTRGGGAHAAASEPKSGSVVASAVIGGRSPASGRSQRSCCSSVPSASTGSAKKPLEVIRLPIPAQPWQSSSWTRQPVNASVSPPPPQRLGQHERRQPDRRGLVPRLPGRPDVGLVDLRRDRTDLARGEVAAHALDLLLLIGESDHRPRKLPLLTVWSGII
jgi:hypothetical protein